MYVGIWGASVAGFGLVCRRGVSLRRVVGSHECCSAVSHLGLGPKSLDKLFVTWADVQLLVVEESIR